MLVRGKIPNSEPIINIGLVLPDDQIKEIKISCSNQSAFDLLINDSANETKKNELNISVYDGQLFFNDNDCSNIKINACSNSREEYILIDSLPAGRGFHWRNNISVKVLGNIIIMIMKNYIIFLSKNYSPK